MHSLLWRLPNPSGELRVLRVTMLYLALMPIIFVSLYGITVKDDGYGDQDALD